MGRAESIVREDILNRVGCENLEKSEKSVDIAGRWTVWRRGGRGRHHVPTEFQEKL
jgi:hypothetical protein